MIAHVDNRITYNGNGIATEFAYTFKILEKSDIKVLHVAKDGTEELLTKDYYVDMEKRVVLYPGYAPGAEIPEQNRPPILPVGERLVIYREVPITQESALDKHWPFNVIEAGLDKLTIICQQLFDRLQRNFYVSESTSTNFDTKVPIEAGKTFRVKDDGTGFEVTEDPGKVIDGATALLKQTTEQAEFAKEQADASSQSAVSAQNAATKAENAALVNKRWPYTDYSVGDVVLCEGSQSLQLVCVTAGTTALADLDITGNVAGDTIIDGTVTWLITNKIVSSRQGKITTDIYFDHVSAYNLQGGCYVKDNIYVFAYPTTDNNTILKAVNAKTLVEIWEVTLQLYHANSITYNPDDDNLYIAACTASDDSLSKNVFVVNYSTHDKINKTIVLDKGSLAFSVAYNRTEKKYYTVQDRGTTEGVANAVFVYNKDWAYEKTIILDNIITEFGTYNTQGIHLALKDRLFVVSYNPACILVYNINGKFIEKISVPSVINDFRNIYELQFITHDGNDFVIGATSISTGFKDRLLNTFFKIGIDHRIDEFDIKSCFNTYILNRRIVLFVNPNRNDLVPPRLLSANYQFKSLYDAINLIKILGASADINIYNSDADTQAYIYNVTFSNLRCRIYHSLNECFAVNCSANNSDILFQNIYFAGESQIQNGNVFAAFHSNVSFYKCTFENDSNANAHILANLGTRLFVSNDCNFINTVSAANIVVDLNSVLLSCPSSCTVNYLSSSTRLAKYEEINAIRATQYIKFANGLLLCWGTPTITAKTQVNFPIPYINIPVVVASSALSDAIVGTGIIYKNSFTLEASKYQAYIRWISIGYWK